MLSGSRTLRPQEVAAMCGLRLQGHMKKTETLERVKVAICKGKWEEALKKLNVLFFLFQTLFSSICMAI